MVASTFIASSAHKIIICYNYWWQLPIGPFSTPICCKGIGQGWLGHFEFKLFYCFFNTDLTQVTTLVRSCHLIISLHICCLSLVTHCLFLWLWMWVSHVYVKTEIQTLLPNDVNSLTAALLTYLLQLHAHNTSAENRYPNVNRLIG